MTTGALRGTGTAGDRMPAGETSAHAYWRAACLLGFSHTAGFSWPPPGRAQRDRAVGHWGCNPGIAWIVGHLAEACAGPDFLLIVGTGHADSFVFAHEALCQSADSWSLSEQTRTYGQAGGSPTELVGASDVPFLGGELGPALGVGQGIAAAAPGRRVVTVVGDGECETPAALAAFAHRDVLLRPGDGAIWLPAVNVNGARMGSAARFSLGQLRRLLRGLGYAVVSSGVTSSSRAVDAARRAWALAERGLPVVWLSHSEKGWPAPAELGGQPFRRHHAHKAAGLDSTDARTGEEIRRWLAELDTPGALAADGRPRPALSALARRARRDLPSSSAQLPATANLEPDGVDDGSPITAVDLVIARRGIRVFSPDEASSNRLFRSLAAGLVTEVLAEELCSAWTWGHVEAGVPAAVVSYEAFAPLIATQIAQYLKILAHRPPVGRPPYLLVLTSLGWANSPTHQNTDIVAGPLARAGGPVRLVFPIGAASAGARFADLADRRDHVGVVVCSKQVLPHLPDPGGTAVLITVGGDGGHDGILIAVGDIAVAESVAAMLLAARCGVGLRVVALVDLNALDGSDGSALRAACAGPAPAVCVSWIAEQHLAATYRRARPASASAVGYRERWGATPWETLRANGLTRWCLLRRLTAEGCALPAEVLTESGDCVPGARSGVPDLALEVRPLC